MTQGKTQEHVITADPEFLIRKKGKERFILSLPPQAFVQTSQISPDRLLTTSVIQPIGLFTMPKSMQNSTITLNELIFLNGGYFANEFGFPEVHDTGLKKNNTEFFFSAFNDSIFNLSQSNSEKTTRHMNEIIHNEKQYRITQSEKAQPKWLDLDDNQRGVEDHVQDRTVREFEDHIITIETAPIVNQLPVQLDLPTIVNVHVGGLANKITTSFGADAVTLGKDIFFARGALDFSTPVGASLLVHELTHVSQNAGTNYLHSKPFDRPLEDKAINNEKTTLEILKKNGNFGRNSTSEDGNMREDGNFTLIDNNTEMILSSPRFTNISNLQSESSTLENNTSFVFSNPLTQNHHSHTSKTYFDSHETPTLTFISSPNYSDNTTNTTHVVTEMPTRPLTAPSDRSTSTNPSAAQSAPVTPSPMSVNVDMIAEQVYDKITRKIKQERDRIGYR